MELDELTLFDYLRLLSECNAIFALSALCSYLQLLEKTYKLTSEEYLSLLHSNCRGDIKNDREKSERIKGSRRISSVV